MLSIIYLESFYDFKKMKIRSFKSKPWTHCFIFNLLIKIIIRPSDVCSMRQSTQRPQHIILKFVWFQISRPNTAQHSQLFRTSLSKTQMPYLPTHRSIFFFFLKEVEMYLAICKRKYFWTMLTRKRAWHLMTRCMKGRPAQRFYKPILTWKLFT